VTTMLEDLSTLPPNRLGKQLETLAQDALPCHEVTVFDGNSDEGLTVALHVDSRRRRDILDLARVVEDDAAVHASCGWSLLVPTRRRPTWRLLLRVSFERPVQCLFTLGFDLRDHPSDTLRATLPLLLAANRLVFVLDGRLDPERPLVWIAARRTRARSGSARGCRLVASAASTRKHAVSGPTPTAPKQLRKSRCANSASFPGRHRGLPIPLHQSTVRGSGDPGAADAPYTHRRHVRLVALPRDPSELPRPLPDGRMFHSSKPHSYEKLFYWSRVLQEFARRTKKWTGRRVCIDLFASCGIYEDTETFELGWGSPLLALHAVDPFDVYIFGEKDAERAEVLAARIEDTNIAAHVARLKLYDPEIMRAALSFKGVDVNGPKVAVITGDANRAVPVVKRMMPGFEGRRIALSMVDPYGAEFEWDSLAGLTLHERMDIFMLFPEDMDIERNLQHEDRLNRYMPPGLNWQSAVKNARNRGRAMREIYELGITDQLSLLVGEPKTIRVNGRDMYKLLYASRHKSGLDVWDHARREDPGGQIELYLA
jgi:three-Cys-motif partner protein